MFGELHPKVLAELDVKGPVVGFVLWPEEVPEPRKAAVALEKRMLPCPFSIMAGSTDLAAEKAPMTSRRKISSSSA